MSKAIFNVNMDRIRHLRDLKENKVLYVAINKSLPVAMFRSFLYCDENGNPVNKLFNTAIFTNKELAENFFLSKDLDVAIQEIDGSMLEDEVKEIMTENQKYMDHIKFDQDTEEIYEVE